MQSAEPCAKKLVQEDACAVALLPQIKFVYAWLGYSNPVGSNEVNPLVEPKDYLISFAANAAGDTVPGFNVSPRDGYHFSFAGDGLLTLQIQNIQEKAFLINCGLGYAAESLEYA